MSEISVVTVARDRTEHLICSAELVAQSSIHREHLILDFGPTSENDHHLLPADPRIRLIRCNWADEWWLTNAYNLAFALIDGDWFLKLDADDLIPPDFLAQLASMQTPALRSSCVIASQCRTGSCRRRCSALMVCSLYRGLR